MLIARWESRGGKYWLELHKDTNGFTYDGEGCGGILGQLTYMEAMEHIRRILLTYRVKMHRVKNKK